MTSRLDFVSGLELRSGYEVAERPFVLMQQIGGRLDSQARFADQECSFEDIAEGHFTMGLVGYFSHARSATLARISLQP